MNAILTSLFDGSYAPHGYCLLWQPALIWTHVVSDALIAAAYFSIPIALITFVRRRPDIEFGGMFWLFAVFILSCGLTHVMGIWNLWHGNYAIEATIKAITAAASVPTAILLRPLLPKALAIPSPSMLQRKNDDLALALQERDGLLDQLRGEIAGRERAEAALVQSKKIEAVGQLTGGIAHDFNNLLQAVSGNLELIAMAPDNCEKVERWAANAKAAVERGARLTGQLLTFSRQQRLELQSIDVAELLEGMRELARNSVGPRVDIEIVADAGLCAVSADPTQLELAVLNLAINARDAMPKGGRLTVHAQMRRLSDQDAVAITVTDTGTGMAPDVLERALEPFFTTKGPGQGTGLGLSMAYGVAQQAGGELVLQSREGEGTVVTMLIPCREPGEAPASPAAAAAGPAEAPTAFDGPASILLVDDDHEVRNTVADMLTGAGLRVRQAHSGDEALRLLEQGDTDLMLLDFAMPGMNGAELAAAASRLYPALKMLFLTGFSDSEAIDRAVDGQVQVLKKPVSAETLTAAIADLLA
jgi:signal transduction histidine kinase